MEDEIKLTPQKKYYLKNKKELQERKNYLYNNDEKYHEMMKNSKHEYYLRNKEELNKKRAEKLRIKKLNDKDYDVKLKQYAKEYRLKKKELNE
jgi:hypothetical protein